MADLERSQCRCACGRSTWGRRTKSFLGSVKKRLSLRSSKTSEDVAERKTGDLLLRPDGGDPEPEWPNDAHPSSSIEELPAFSEPVELQPNQTFVPELAACPPNWAATPSLRLNPYSSPPGPYTHSFGCAQTPYVPGIGMNPFPQSGPPPRAQTVYHHELAAHAPNHSLHTAAWYSSPPTASSADFPTMSQCTTSELGRHSLVSTQSSIPGVPLSLFTGATTVAAREAPSFTTQMTSSPTEYGQDGGGVAPWHAKPPPSHHNSWDSASTAVELPGGPPYPVSGATQWLQTPAPGPLPELEGTVSFMKPSMPLLPQGFGGMQPMAPLELATEANVQLQLEPSRWDTPLMMDMEKHAMMAVQNTPHPYLGHFKFHTHPSPIRPGPRPLTAQARQFSYDSAADTILDFSRPDKSPYFQGHASPIRPGPRPLISQGRQHSYDSTADTILDFPISDSPPCPQETYTYTYPSPPNPPSFEFQSPLPSQQKHSQPPTTPNPPKPQPLNRRRSRKPNPKQQQQQQQHPPPPPPPADPTCCHPCNFHPSPGTAQRRKMEKHKLTDRHRRNTAAAGQEGDAGEGVVGKGTKFPCRVEGCVSAYNREDNLRQHVVRKHKHTKGGLEAGGTVRRAGRGAGRMGRRLGVRGGNGELRVGVSTGS